MNQGDLFNRLRDPPATHTADPDSSREALNAHEESGARGRNQRLVLRLVEANPDSTAIELWADADADLQHVLKEPQEIRRRLTDLLAKGLVQQGRQRRCRVRGTTQVTWHVTQTRGLPD